MSEKVLVDREQLERAASVIAWMSCRSDIKAADLKRLEQCASELSCALTVPESQVVPVARQAAPAAPEVDLSSDERVAALCDLSYRAGLKAGWNYCTDDDPDGFARSLESAREAVSVLGKYRQKGAPAAPVVQGPVATILPPDPLDEREGPWLSLEDWERLRALPSGTRLYAAPPAQHDAALVEAANAALKAIQDTLEDAYHNAFPECCGQAHLECCGSPIQAWDERDKKIMDRLGPHEKALRAALAGKGGE